MSRRFHLRSSMGSKIGVMINEDFPSVIGGCPIRSIIISPIDESPGLYRRANNKLEPVRIEDLPILNNSKMFNIELLLLLKNERTEIVTEAFVAKSNNIIQSLRLCIENKAYELIEGSISVDYQDITINKRLNEVLMPFLFKREHLKSIPNNNMSKYPNLSKLGLMQNSS